MPQESLPSLPPVLTRFAPPLSDDDRALWDATSSASLFFDRAEQVGP